MRVAATDLIGLAPVEVVDLHDVWSIVASSVAGRSVEVVTGDHHLAWSDGEAIHLPADIAVDDAAVAVVVQAALLASGGLDREVIGRLSARSELARRYLTLEGARAVTTRSVVVPRRVAHHVQSVWGATPTTSAAESLARASGRDPVPAAPERWGTIRPRLVRTGARSGGWVPGQLDQQGRTEFVDTPEMDDEEDSESINFMKLLNTPVNVFGENPLMRWMKRNLGVGTREDPDGGAGGGAEMPAGGASWGQDPGASARPVEAVAGRALQQRPTDPAGRFRHPEWDHFTQAYRLEHCHVREMDPRPERGGVRPRLDPLLRREIASLGLDYERHRRQLEGPDLDLAAVVDFTVSRSRREQPDDRIYQTRLKTARDLAVLVLLDASGSTGDTSADGTTIFDEERQVVADLVEALDVMGDRVAAFAFSSRGRGDVRFLRIKEFDGRLDDAALARLAGIRPTGYTRLGAAIRHAAATVSTKGGASNSLVVLVSDGLPYDDGYEGAYAEADTRRALEEAVANGIGCLCVSVGARQDDAALAALWGGASHTRLRDATELAPAITPLFRSALAIASQRGGALRPA